MKALAVDNTVVIQRRSELIIQALLGHSSRLYREGVSIFTEARELIIQAQVLIERGVEVRISIVGT